MRARCKILHVVRAMDRGGVETWLMNMLRNIDRTRFEFHFLVNKPTPGAYDQEIESLGGTIHVGPDPHGLLSFTSSLSALLREQGPFDVVHSHLYWYAGVILKVARGASVPVRIAHSHTSRHTPGLNIGRRSYETIMRRAVARYATDKLAVSREAGEALFGKTTPMPFRIVPYGMDFARFGRLESKQELRRRLGIPVERTVLGHVGRFVPVKNHRFLLEIFGAVVRQRAAHLLLVGDGPLMPEIQRLAADEGISDRCTFTGLREDVAPCMGAMDVLVLPSLWEGLPIVALEAQSAAVPVLASEGVSREVDVIPGIVHHLTRDAGAEIWAAESLRLAAKEGCRASSADLLHTSKFGLEKCISTLEEIYSQTSPAKFEGAAA